MMTGLAPSALDAPLRTRPESSSESGPSKQAPADSTSASSMEESSKSGGRTKLGCLSCRLRKKVRSGMHPTSLGSVGRAAKCLCGHTGLMSEGSELTSDSDATRPSRPASHVPGWVSSVLDTARSDLVGLGGMTTASRRAKSSPRRSWPSAAGRGQRRRKRSCLSRSASGPARFNARHRSRSTAQSLPRSQ